MKNRQRLLPRLAALLAWLVFPCAQAQDAPAQAPSPACPPAAAAPTHEQVNAGMREARDRGFLWRVTRDGRSSYLYGTVHVARFGWMFPGPRVSQALAESQTVALELDILDPRVQSEMVQGMASHRGAAMADADRRRLQERLRRQMRALCLDAGQQAGLEGMSPEMQLVAVTILTARPDGIDPAYSIDAFLAGYARGRKKAVVSLETPAGQMKVFGADNEADGLVALERGLADLESGQSRRMLLRVARLWADSDQPQLDRYEEWCGCVGTEAERGMMKRMLDDRNPAMADRIDAMHAQGQSVFAAVGSLHLIGPTGLPALMAKKGYRVERVAW